jgi:hypothetical protein
MLLACLYWLIILLANAHFAQVARLAKGSGIKVRALSVICPSVARRIIVARRLHNNFNRRFRARRDLRRLARANARMCAAKGQISSVVNLY